MNIEDKVTQEGKVFKSKKVNKSKTFQKGDDFYDVACFLRDHVETEDVYSTLEAEENQEIIVELQQKYIITVTRFND